MSSCFILSDIGHGGETVRAPRSVFAAKVFKKLGFTPQVLGQAIVKDEAESASNYETQHGVANGFRTIYTNKAASLLGTRVQKGDLVVATECWHADIFKGALSHELGLYNHTPVVELWIDYPYPFARYRVFSTRFTYYWIAGYARRQAVSSEWTHAVPHYEARLSSRTAMEARAVEDNPFALDFMYDACAGVPLAAPDWGAWSEMIGHGVSGVLYRTDQGREQALKAIRDIPGKQVVQYVNENFSLDIAADSLRAYIQRVMD